ncbi:helix-turn-helix domain-containing protein [Cellulomonas sp. NPDC089187]|uniref:TetR/AcrR family transcriptional regulator n=1 Tax=Cellulomonas sp. NPDC089187 TaxID=3154970 RepID=UPI00341A380D
MSEPQRSQESIGAAARALADATAALTRALGDEVHSVGPQVTESIAASLREASQGLTSASDRLSGTARARRSRGRRAERVEQTRAELLAAAASAFAERGYEGASVGEIAAQAGYTKGAVYAHFGSKEEMLHALVAELDCEDDNPVFPWFTEQGVDEDALVAEVLALRQDSRTLLVVEVYLYAMRHPEGGSAIVERYRRNLDRLTRRVAELRGPDGAREVAAAAAAVLDNAVLYGGLVDEPQISARGAARQVARLLASEN